MPISQDPIMLGGTFGNNQQSQILMAIPETKCKDLNEFLEGICIPCPRGSMPTSQNQCDFCDSDEYFVENTDDYFKSECRYCPLGTVGGQGVECVPCESGTIWQEGGTCKTCEPENFCPIGTKYEFPKEQYQ